MTNSAITVRPRTSDDHVLRCNLCAVDRNLTILSIKVDGQVSEHKFALCITHVVELANAAVERVQWLPTVRRSTITRWYSR